MSYLIKRCTSISNKKIGLRIFFVESSSLARWSSGTSSPGTMRMRILGRRWSSPRRPENGPFSFFFVFFSLFFKVCFMLLFFHGVFFVMLSCFFLFFIAKNPGKISDLFCSLLFPKKTYRRCSTSAKTRNCLIIDQLLGDIMMLWLSPHFCQVGFWRLKVETVASPIIRVRSAGEGLKGRKLVVLIPHRNPSTSHPF